jgi:hypothetical protein
MDWRSLVKVELIGEVRWWCHTGICFVCLFTCTESIDRSQPASQVYYSDEHSWREFALRWVLAALEVVRPFLFPKPAGPIHAGAHQLAGKLIVRTLNYMFWFCTHRLASHHGTKVKPTAMAGRSSPMQSLSHTHFGFWRDGLILWRSKCASAGRR